MKKSITKKEFLAKEKFFLKEIKTGKIFIYPTDTIYGLGCIATNKNSIRKIRQIKQRDEKPFSIIIPHKKWISKNCVTKKAHAKFIKKLPGKYTLILRLKKPMPKEITRTKTLGVRIPKNWFAKFLAKHNLLFITTSVNLSSQPHLTNPRELSKKIYKKINYIIDDGILANKPSKLVILTGEKPEQISRKHKNL